MKKIIITLSAGLILSLGLSSCKKDDPMNEENIQLGSNEIPASTLNLGQTVTSDFFGQVKDEVGQPIENVDVRIGNISTQTNAYGTFELTGVSVSELLACVSLEKDGYLNCAYSLRPNSTGPTTLNVTMASSSLSAYEVSQVTTISDAGASVEMRSYLVDASGNAYDDQATMNLRSFSSNTTDKSFPGSNFAQNDLGEAGVITTYGALGVELYGSSGQQLQLANGTTAEVSVSIDPAQLSGAPSTIPMWFLDETTGYWIQEGAATLENGKYVGEVGHFTFWTFGTFANWALLHGDLDDNLGGAMPYIDVTLTENLNSITGPTNYQGQFTSYVSANEVITVDVLDQCGNAVLTQNVGPFNSGSSNSESFVVTPGNGYHQIVGTINDCTGNPITSGWLYAQTAQNSDAYFLYNGNLNLYHYDCSNPSTGNFLLTDLSSGDQESLPNVAPVSSVFDLGTVTTCPGPAEYLNYTVDGTPVPIDVPFYCAVADSFGTGISISVEWQQNVAPWYVLYIQGSDDQLGAQPYSPDPSLVPGYRVSTNINPLWGSTQNMTFNLTAFPANVGDYFDITGTGTYTDISSVVHTIDIDLHVLRDL